MAITIDGTDGISPLKASGQVQTTTGTAAAPAVASSSDADSGLFFGTNEVNISTGGTLRAKVDSSGKLDVVSGDFRVTGGEGISAALYLVADEGDDNGDSWRIISNQDANDLTISNNDSGSFSDLFTFTKAGHLGVGHGSPQFGLTLSQESDDSGKLGWEDGGNDKRASITCSSSSDALQFHTGTSDAERMRIDSSGRLIIGKTATAFQTAGAVFFPHGELNITRDGGVPVFIRRNSDDGQLINFNQDGTSEGNISVSGSTVAIQGAHLSRWSQLAGGAARTEILRGSVLSNLDEMCEWTYAAQDAVLYTEEDQLPEGASVGDVKTPAVEAHTEDNEQLNRMKVSDVEGDVNVAGVFQDWDDDDDTHTNDFNCAMTGDFVIRIAQGTTVARGDLLMSAGDGTAKPQDDDIVRSKTIAKVTSTTVSCTYDDGSYCVPCVLMAC
jgi:hypothetical protein